MHVIVLVISNDKFRLHMYCVTSFSVLYIQLFSTLNWYFVTSEYNPQFNFSFEKLLLFWLEKLKLWIVFTCEIIKKNSWFTVSIWKYLLHKYLVGAHNKQFFVYTLDIVYSLALCFLFFLDKFHRMYDCRERLHMDQIIGQGIQNISRKHLSHLTPVQHS